MQQWPGQQVSPAQQQPAQPTQQPAPQPVQRAPGIIRGAPAPVDPMEQERLRLQQEAAARAAQADARQQAAFEGTGGQGTEAQNKAAVLLGRIQGGFADIEDIIGTYPEAERPGLAETLSYGALGPESVIARQTTDWQRRAINDVQRDIVDALLTMGTGAAYNQEQLEAMRVSYFPQYGDTPDEIAYKRRRLQRMIDTARLQAGPNAARLDEALGPLMQSLQQPTEQRTPTTRDEAPLGYETGFDRMGRDDVFDRAAALQETFGITPGKETRLVGMLNANRGNENFTVESLAQIYSDLGIPTPTPEQMEEMAQGVREGRTATGIDTSAMEREYTQGLDAALNQMGEDPTSDAAALTYGVARGGTLSLNDEITGVGAAIGGLFSGQNPLETYQVYRDLVRRQTERTREESPYLSYGGEIAGALVTGARGFGGVSTVKDAAKVGAIEGGIYGFGEGEGVAGSALGAGLGALTGGAVGAGVQRGLNALATRQATRAAQAAPVVEAAERRGLTENIRGADIDPTLRGPRAQLMQGQNRETLRGVERDDLDAMQEALMRDLSGANAGNASGNQARGDVIQNSANAVVENTRAQAGRLYDSARAKSGNIRVEPRQALRVINEQIAELEEAGRNANKGSIEFLEGLRADLGRSGGVGIDTLRGQRTNLRGNISASNLSLTDTERRATIVLDALSQDIRTGLQGNPALSEFRRADHLWRQQADFQKEIIRKLVGTDANPVPAETAARRVEAFIKGDYKRAKSLLEAIGPEGRAAVREQVAVSLGRSRNGDFSPALFLKHTGDGAGSQIPQKSLVLLFGKDGVKAVQDLRTIAQAKVDAGSATNFSNTGGIVQRGMSGLRRLLLGGAGFAIAVDAGGGLGVGSLAAAGTALGGEIVSNLGERRTMRLLLNPDFTKWLRNAPNTSDPRVINRVFESLRSTASKSPLFAADVNALEQVLIGYANDNARRLAAEPSGTEQPEE